MSRSSDAVTNPIATPPLPESADPAEKLALSALGVAVIDWDLRTDVLACDLVWNRTVRLRGSAAVPTSAPPAEFERRLHPKDRARVEALFSAHRAGGEDRFEVEHGLKRDDGDWRRVRTSVAVERGREGRARRFVLAVTDHTERRRAEEQIARHAFHDGITGLPNRVLFLELIRRAIRLARRRGTPSFAVVVASVDRWDRVSAGIGHRARDVVLEAIGRRLLELAGAGDTVARLRGGEFGLLVEDVHTLLAVTHRVERVRERLAEPFDLFGEPLRLSVSIGVTLARAEHRRAEDVVGEAHAAADRARAERAGGTRVSDTSSHLKAVRLVSLETELGQALERGELFVVYQPIVSLATGRLAAVEALVRWQHPERGVLPPMEFLPLAEETGLIVPLGRRVLALAAHDLTRWQQDLPRDPPLVMHVNLSGAQVLAELPDTIEALLKEYCPLPGTLKLELTESSLMADPPEAARLLTALRDQGVRLCIDDFGTGYSSLSYLRRFPLDTLKIDSSFTKSLVGQGADQVIARTIVGLAHNLAMNVVAEGVREPEQAAVLRSMGCEYGQGTLFGKPTRAEEFVKLLEADPVGG